MKKLELTIIYMFIEYKDHKNLSVLTPIYINPLYLYTEKWQKHTKTIRIQPANIR